MYRGLIDYLLFAYAFINKARGRADERGIGSMRDASHFAAQNAENVLSDGKEMSEEDKVGLRQVHLVDQHIEEAYVFQTSLEIV